MKHHIKNLYAFNIQPSNQVPDFIGQRERFTCCHCNKQTVVAVPSTGIDWEFVAKDYKRYAQKMHDRFGQIVADITVMQSGENPVINYLENEFKTLLSELGKMMPEEGDEWKD